MDSYEIAEKVEILSRQTSENPLENERVWNARNEFLRELGIWMENHPLCTLEKIEIRVNKQEQNLYFESAIYYQQIKRCRLLSRFLHVFCLRHK